ncbi:MAG: enoyl-CoA hydratase [Desulfofustis sp.]|nr:enoyl-CoA hydratase [Desulfofustis sp.]
MQDSRLNKDFFSIFRDFKEVSGRYDPEYRAVWCYHNPNPRPVFSTNMLTELITMQQRIMDYFERLDPNAEPMIHYLILLSKVPGIFSMGGDLKLFSRLIKEKDRQQILDYGLKCIKVLYLNSVNMNLPVTTISLIEGQAFGGGFECALSSNIVIATRNSEMGFPEIKFNLFPGMGAYQFIARSCGTLVADKMLSTGDTYSAEELYELGVVHMLCEEGHGIECVEDYLKHHKKRAKVHQALQNVKSRIHPIKYEELERVVELWADTAIGLEDKDLKFIDRVVKSQEIKMTEELAKSRKRTRHDRRFTDSSTTFPITDSFGETIQSDRRKSSDRRS